MGAFGSEKGREWSGLTGTASGTRTAYGAVLGSLHKGALVSFGWGGWAPG